MRSYKNKSVVIRAICDDEHPYDVTPWYFNDYTKYDGVERAILHELSTNKDSFVIHKMVVMKRLGFGRKIFDKAWKKLEQKHHIFGERIKGGWKWVYSEVGDYGEIKTEQSLSTGDNVGDNDTNHCPSEHMLEGTSNHSKKKTSSNSLDLKTKDLRAREAATKIQRDGEKDSSLNWSIKNDIKEEFHPLNLDVNLDDVI